MAMKVFNLRCPQGHHFEGWFSSAEDIDVQRARGLLSCPLCGDAQVEKAPTAPYVKTGGTTEPQQAVRVQQPAAAQAAAKPTSEQLQQLQAMFLKAAREIVAGTEDVGARFAEEARRIHYKEAPERGIRGVASREEAQELNDEGINVMPLPFADLLKDPLQ